MESYPYANRVRCEVCGTWKPPPDMAPGVDGERTCGVCRDIMARAVANGLDEETARDMAAARED